MQCTFYVAFIGWKPPNFGENGSLSYAWHSGVARGGARGPWPPPTWYEGGPEYHLAPPKFHRKYTIFRRNYEIFPLFNQLTHENIIFSCINQFFQFLKAKTWKSLRLRRSVPVYFHVYWKYGVEFWTFGPPQYFGLATPLTFVILS